MVKRLHKRVALAHSGIYSYMREELPTLGLSEDSIPEMFKDETHFNVYRPATVVAKAAPLFARQPVTVEHPDRLVAPHNAKDLMEGMTGDTVRVSYRNGEAYLDSTLTLIAEDAIRYYEEGYREVSPGYITEARWVSEATAYKGMPVHILVTNIPEVNHLALVTAGRGGPTACVLDSKGGSMFLTDLFKAAKNLFTKDSLETAQSLLEQLCIEGITPDKVGVVVDKVVTLTTVFPVSDDKTELLRYLEDLRFAADLNKLEVRAAVNTVLSLYTKLDSLTKETLTKEKDMDDNAPAAAPAQDYAPGATGVAGPGSQKMVGDEKSFIAALKNLISEFEGTGDAEPAKDPEPAPEPAKDAEPAPEPAKDADPAPEPAKDAEPVPPAPEPAKDAEPAPEPAKDAEPTKDAAPAMTATLDSSSGNTGGINSFMKDLFGKE